MDAPARLLSALRDGDDVAPSNGHDGSAKNGTGLSPPLSSSPCDRHRRRRRRQRILLPRLSRWNARLESDLIRGGVGVGGGDGEDDASSSTAADDAVEEGAAALHFALVSAVRLCRRDDTDDDDAAAGDSDDKRRGSACVSVFYPTDADADEAAAKAAAELVADRPSSSPVVSAPRPAPTAVVVDDNEEGDASDGGDVNGGESGAAERRSRGQGSDATDDDERPSNGGDEERNDDGQGARQAAEEEDAAFASETLRACGTYLRWYQQAWRPNRQHRETNGNHTNDNSNGRDPVRRLRSKGMLTLYLALLEGGVGGGGAGGNDRSDGGDDGSGGGDKDAPVATPQRIDGELRRNASVALFRATHGGGDVAAKSALSTFVSSLNGVESIMRQLVLRDDNPVPLVFSLVRHVHHWIGDPDAAPLGIVGRMEDAILDLTAAATATAATNVAADGGAGDATTTMTKKSTMDLAAVLVATLAWAVRSDPPFPGDASDRRSDLALEILRVLFALRNAPGGAKQFNNRGDKNDDADNDTMTQIGILLCDLLHLPNADVRSYECKLAVVHLLMDAPPEYATYLVVNDGIRPLVTILRNQVDTVVVERTGSGRQDASALVPILLVLNRMYGSNAHVRSMVRDAVFPPDAEANFLAKAKKELASAPSAGAGASVGAKNMAPLDAPRHTLRGKLVRLMTWTESNVKRCSSELLWTLCESDATQYVLRTGFGNAVHMLGIKGLVQLPQGTGMM